MSHYFIRGTIKVCVLEGDKTIRITPGTGFLTPEETPRAIAFPVKADASNETPKIAMLFKLTEKELLCDATEIIEYLSALITSASQQKNVELHLIEGKLPPTPAGNDADTSEKKEKVSSGEIKPKIVGFVFPVK